MKVLITGVCGFVGSSLARWFREHRDAERLEVVGIDNLSRAGSEINRNSLGALGVKVVHGDVRLPADLEMFRGVDWVVDAAANPSVLAGIDGSTTSRQLVEHNLVGTLNLLEYCKSREAGLVLLSTSRVYSITPLASLEMEQVGQAFRPRLPTADMVGITEAGLSEGFPTAAPISLYGATKLASEAVALEYFHAFGLPVWINRCGVLAGAGQFGHVAQGIYTYWINSHLRRHPLRYIGFGGTGYQVRDCLHPSDLASLVIRQMECGEEYRPRVVNVAGGVENCMSLAELTAWCDQRFGQNPVLADPSPRPFDVPWMVLDSRLAAEEWRWSPEISLEAILEEIAEHAEKNPNWIEISRGG